MKKTFAALLLAVLTLLAAAIVPAQAAEIDDYPLCPHLHGEHDEHCGYAPAQPEIPCSKPNVCQWLSVPHAGDCAYRAAVPGSPCTHAHTDACKLPTEPAESTGVTYYPDYDEEAPTAVTYRVICSALNVRRTPSILHTRIGRIPRGAELSVIGWEGNWAKVVWNDTTAYVYGAFLAQN